jgi:hypothetical protein
MPSISVMTSLAPIAAALAIVLLVLLAPLTLRALLAVRRERQRGEQLEARLAAMERDRRASCGAQARAGDRLLALEQQVRMLVHGQTQLEMKTPATESYRHAISLVERGASTDELVSSCGLARGEAELVHLLHATSGTQSDAA